MSKPPARRHSLARQQGFTLVELMVATLVLAIILSTLSQIVTSVQKNYQTQAPQNEAFNNANLALTTLVRLLRGAGNNTTQQLIDPGTQVSGHYTTIRIRSDWNSMDGALTGTWEDIKFSVSGGVLYKQEFPADAAAVPFLDQIESLQFVYRDRNLNVITDAATNHTDIALVEITLVARPTGGTATTFTTSVHVRKR
jgi:prepilin-type N-terminal cleavage/methylation domain-containing protein